MSTSLATRPQRPSPRERRARRADRLHDFLHALRAEPPWAAQWASAVQAGTPGTPSARWRSAWRYFWASRHVPRPYLVVATVVLGVFLLIEGYSLTDEPQLTSIGGDPTVAGAMVNLVAMILALVLLWVRPAWAAPCLTLAWVTSTLGEDLFMAIFVVPVLLSTVLVVVSWPLMVTLACLAWLWVAGVWARTLVTDGFAGILDGGVLVSLFYLVSVGSGIFFRWASLRRRRDAAHVRAANAAVREAAARERRVLARDLHDVVAHNLTIIAMQSRTAQFVGTDEAARQALTVVGETSREALTDLRHMLNLLKDAGVVEAGESETVHELDTAGAGPATDLELGVGRLAHQLAELGVAVERRVDLGTAKLPLSAHGALYRVAQEACTNVIKHADRDQPCEIAVHREGDGLILSVSSGLPAGPRPRRRELWNSSHVGMTSMRERVVAFGGTFQAGADGDRWVVRASVPLDDAAAATV
ncbi:MAG: histidine kinase [Micrococcus sp.]|nr:histidine kinase [Micrococcus sp.]